MKAKRYIPAIAMVAILSLAACSDAVGPTGQGPEIGTVLDDQDENAGSQDTQGQQGQKRDNPLDPAQ